MSTTCPYCNASVPRGRGPCPRCGELVPAKGDGAPASAPVNAAPAEPPARTGWTNRQIGLAVLGLMVFMAAIGLGYALKTVEFRRSHDKPEEERAPASVVHPADLPGVGYLPDDVQVIAGVRVSALRSSEPARTALTALGVAIDDAGRVLGVPADDVDHVIVGASVKALPPRLNVVLRARRPINADAVRTALRAGRGNEHNGRMLYEVKLRPKGPDGLLWFADDRTIVGGLVREHFDKLPDPPNPYIGRFPGPLPAIFRDRVDARALAWAAVHIEPDDPTQNLLLGFLPNPGDVQNAWAGLQDLAASLWAEGSELRLTALVRGGGPLANAQLGDSIERALGTIGVVVNERVSDGGWLRLSAKEDAKALAKWLDRAKSGKGP